jgi:hypothetical protein
MFQINQKETILNIIKVHQGKESMIETGSAMISGKSL